MKRIVLLVAVAVLTVAASLSAPKTSQAYECPRTVPYCYQASQCVTYCGSVEFASCYNGCCACLG